MENLLARILSMQYSARKNISDVLKKNSNVNCVSIHCMAVILYLHGLYLCVELKNRQKMNMSKFYSEFIFRYHTEAVPRKISINAYCISESVEYRNFIKYRSRMQDMTFDNRSLRIRYSSVRRGKTIWCLQNII